MKTQTVTVWKGEVEVQDQAEAQAVVARCAGRITGPGQYGGWLAELPDQARLDLREYGAIFFPDAYIAG